jgi:hypothetical protein
VDVRHRVDRLFREHRHGHSPSDGCPCAAGSLHDNRHVFGDQHERQYLDLHGSGLLQKHIGLHRHLRALRFVNGNVHPHESCDQHGLRYLYLHGSGLVYGYERIHGHRHIARNRDAKL